MRRIGWTYGLFGSALLALVGQAQAAPSLRLQIDQRGDFTMVGNTLGRDCRTGVPAPVVGTVGNCGSNTADASPDVFWRAEDNNTALADSSVTLAQARTTAVLQLPQGATVTQAYLYWGARRAGLGADVDVTLERPGDFAQAISAIRSTAITDPPSACFYQSVADVTALVAEHGPGPYRVAGIDSDNFVGLDREVTFSAWTLVVFYALDTAPPRNLALFDGLDQVSSGNNQSASLAGFVVPNAGFDAKLGVIAYDGTFDQAGDSLLFGVAPLTSSNRLSDAQNPPTNFFNGTRSWLGTAQSVAGDLPQLTGGQGSMSGIDIDVIDISSRVTSGQTQADIQVTSSGDIYFLGAFITSISTFKPDLSLSSKTAVDINGGALLAGDEVEYTMVISNSGNDTSINTVLIDTLPTGINFVPGSLQIVAGPNEGTKTDAIDSDQAEYNAAQRAVIFRLGSGANGILGGQLGPGEQTTIRFRATVSGAVLGQISNQAEISVEGLLGAPVQTYLTDSNPTLPGAQATTIYVDACGTDAQCAPPNPRCFTDPTPNVCVQCLQSSDCSGTTPVCNTTTHTCNPCTSDANCSGNTPACQSSGACGQCSPTNTSQCTGTTPICNTTTGTCVGCATDADCGGQTPACLPSGACGQCSPTNTTLCTGTTPVCDPGSGTCVGCVNASNCSGTTPVCSSTTHTCVGCSNDSECGGQTPACQSSGACGECSPTNSTLCVATTPVCWPDQGICVGCLQSSDCPILTPTCDASTHSCICVATGAEVCGNQVDEDCSGQLDNGCPDTDQDGLIDAIETNIGTDPNDADSDDDGVPDGQEPSYDQDSDGDGLINALDPDSDNDGLFDGTEMGMGCSGPGVDASRKHCVADGDQGATVTDPLAPDTDGGGKTDGSEDFNLNGVIDSGETDPTAGHGADDSTVVDTDSDGLGDGLETTLGSNPTDADTDDDGVPDGQEPNPSDDTDRDGLLNVLDVDSDNDGLYDGTEMGMGCSGPGTDPEKKHCIADVDSGATKTSPLLWDTDHGGVSDGSEDTNLNGVIDSGETDPTAGHPQDDSTVTDTDHDGLSDGLENTLGSNPNDADSDDDGLPDGQEANPSDDHDLDGARNVNDPDSDGDGLYDGTERGLDCSNPATDTSHNTCIPDADLGQTTTGELTPDTDKGGVNDGTEDTNKNGRVDPGERDPNNRADDGQSGPCTIDSDCGGLTSGQVCENGLCVSGCRGTGGNGCAPGQGCTSTDNTIGQCVSLLDGGPDGEAGPEGMDNQIEGGGFSCAMGSRGQGLSTWLLSLGLLGLWGARRRMQQR